MYLRRITAACAFVAASAAPAWAQHVCAERDVLLDSLAEEYQEQRTARGMSDTGNVVEVLAEENGKTWTIIMTMPDGVSCIIATGEAWEDMPEQLAGSDT